MTLAIRAANGVGTIRFSTAKIACLFAPLFRIPPVVRVCCLANDSAPSVDIALAPLLRCGAIPVLVLFSLYFCGSANLLWLVSAPLGDFCLDALSALIAKARKSCLVLVEGP